MRAGKFISQEKLNPTRKNGVKITKQRRGCGI